MRFRATYFGLMILLFTQVLPAQQAPLPPRLETYKQVDQVELKAHVFEPPAPTEGRRPTVLLFHGGGWNSGDGTWVYPAARRFAALGLVAIAIDYRLADGKSVTPLEAMADTRDAFRWARSQSARLRIDPKRVAGYGVSAGGHLVSAAALIGKAPNLPVEAQERPDALVLYSPALGISDSVWVRRLLLGRATPETISPDAFVAAGMPPTFISQGDEDTVTPAAKAVPFARRMRALGNICELQRHSGLGHLLSRKLDEQEWQFDPDPMARTAAWRAEEAFLARHGFLSPQPAAPLSPEAVVRTFTEALNAKDEKQVSGMMAPNIHWLSLVGDGMQVEAMGEEALRLRLADAFRREPNLKRELHMLVTNGSFVSVRERSVWTGSKGEARSRNTFVVYEVVEGFVARVWIYPSQP